MNENLRPIRIDYRGPEGTKVWADEDGVHLHIPDNITGLEMPDVKKLIQIYELALAAWESDEGLQPRPPTREEILEMPYLQKREYAAKDIIDSLKKTYKEMPF